MRWTATLFAAFDPEELTSSAPPTQALIRRTDEDHLSLATDQGRVLYSFNVGDFHEIHTEWIENGRDHAGIIIGAAEAWRSRSATQPGEQIRRLLRLIGSLTAEAMRNREEFLGRW